VSLAVLTARAAQLLEQGPAAASTAREAFGMGRLYERAGLTGDALAAFARARHEPAGRARTGRGSGVRPDALRASALLLRRLRRYEEAASCWRELLAAPGCPDTYAREAVDALAVHHEHRVRDLGAARAFALQSLRLQSSATRKHAAAHRLARLDRKLTGAPPSVGLPLGGDPQAVGDPHERRHDAR
jgi:hypothetical protein